MLIVRYWWNALYVELAMFRFVIFYHRLRWYECFLRSANIYVRQQKKSPMESDNCCYDGEDEEEFFKSLMI